MAVLHEIAAHNNPKPIWTDYSSPYRVPRAIPLVQIHGTQNDYTPRTISNSEVRPSRIKRSGRPTRVMRGACSMFHVKHTKRVIVHSKLSPLSPWRASEPAVQISGWSGQARPWRRVGQREGGRVGLYASTVSCFNKPLLVAPAERQLS